MQTINFCFESTALSFCFKFGQILDLFHFFNPSELSFFLTVGAVFGVEVRLENIFGTYKCRLSIFVLEVQLYLLVFHSAKFWAFFCIFWALRGYFWGWGQVQKPLWDLLTQTNNFYFGSIALSCFFETFPGGWVAGWLVGKSDFNENPVVSLDLDLDFGL